MSVANQLDASNSQTFTGSSVVIEEERSVRHNVGVWIKGDGGSNMSREIDARHPSTCKWLLEHPAFRKWLEANESTHLFLSAPPGAGKTVLASTIAQHLKKLKYRTSVFHFSFDNRERRNTIYALRALALDLLSFQTFVPDSVKTLYASNLDVQERELRSISTAIELLRGLMKQIPRVHIILDGLDECRDRNHLLPTLKTILEFDTLGIVKWFFTSRPERIIRQELCRKKVYEIEAPIESINSDIKVFMLGERHEEISHLRWMETIEGLMKKAEGNFLWAKLILPTLPRDASSIDGKLDSVQYNLNGLYFRALRLLARRPSHDRIRAATIFAFLVASIQPLRLSELSHALVADQASLDFSKLVGGHLSLSLIEDLCSNLVVFDRSLPGCSEDPVLRFTHKSVYDFFVQDFKPKSSPGEIGRFSEEKERDERKNSLPGIESYGQRIEFLTQFIRSMRAPQVVASFFTTPYDANTKLGEACLQYLRNPRYDECRQPSTLIEKEEHAFLKYAAVFWHIHVSQLHPSVRIQSQVEAFLSGPSFWNCVTIQCQIAPHLYAVYLKDNDGYIVMDGRSAIHAGSSTRLHYGSPLPLWLDTPRAKDFHAFVRQWHRVLNSYPRYIDHCYMDTGWELRWPSHRYWLSNRIRCWSTHSEALLADEPVPSDTRHASELEKQHADDDRYIHRHHTQLMLLVQRNKEQLRLTEQESESASGRLDIQSVDTAAHRFFDWAVSGYTSDTRLTKSTNAITPRIVAVHWTTGFSQVGRNMVPRSDRLGSISLRSDKSLPASRSFPSHSVADSVCSSIDDSETAAFNSGIDKLSETASMVAEKELRNGLQTKQDHRLLITREGTTTNLYSWSSSSHINFTVRSAFHPFEPWACWSPSAYEFCIANTDDGSIEKCHVPEPFETIFPSTDTVFKECHISQDGKCIFFLTAIVALLNSKIEYNVALSSFELYRKDDGTRALHPLGSVMTFVYYSTEDNYSKVPMLTAWGSDYVYVALPPLSCNPKIIRLSLHAQTSSNFETLQEPIFFPSTTIDRSPIMYCISRIGEEDRLVLALSAETTTEDIEGKVAVADDHVSNETSTLFGHCPATPNGSVRQESIMMSWKLGRHEQWRVWNSELDSRSKDTTHMLATISRPRNSYAQDKTLFRVSIRSDLNWRTKAFISCY